jgi:hypothetical protein
MRKLWVVAYYTAIESIRNKVFYITLLFALIVISSSIVFSQISGEVAGRVIVDVGLGAIELFALQRGRNCFKFACFGCKFCISKNVINYGNRAFLFFIFYFFC